MLKWPKPKPEDYINPGERARLRYLKAQQLALAKKLASAKTAEELRAMLDKLRGDEAR